MEFSVSYSIHEHVIISILAEENIFNTFTTLHNIHMLLFRYLNLYLRDI